MPSLTFIAEWGQAPDLETAIRQADMTKRFGGQVAKWQMFDPVRLASVHAERYWDPGLGGQRSQLDTFDDNGSLTRRQWSMLADYCHSIGVGFLVTPFDLESVDTLAEIGVTAVKIASADITYRDLIERVAALGVPVIMSCGAASWMEIEVAFAWWREASRHGDITSSHGDITLMACDLVYPCPDHDADLWRVADLHARYGKVGYSDHTLGTLTGAVAAALGATVLEKHCTLDPEGVAPDNRMALTPDLAAEYIRNAAQALTLTAPVTGDPQHAARIQARRAWHAARDLPSGHVIAADDVVALRPCPDGALSVARSAVGRRLHAAVKAGDPVPA